MRKSAVCALLLCWPLASTAAIQGAGRGAYNGSSQRLPDSVVVAGRAADVSYYSADLLLRYGFSENLEFNFGGYLYNYSRYDTGNETFTDSGVGDARLGLRYAIPATGRGPYVSLRSGITLPVGDDAFSVNDETLDVGASFNWRAGDWQSFGFGVSGAYSNSWQSVYGSVAWSFLFGPTAGGYLEVGGYGGDSSGSVGGGGLSFRVAKGTDIDIYALAGLADEAPDMQAGIGLSIYFD